MKGGSICMDRSITRGIGAAIRNSAEVPRGKGPKSAQVALRIAGMAADAAAALFAVATCIRIFSEIIKGKK
jgi:hypothetical protein